VKRRFFAGIVLDAALRASCADAAERLRRTGYTARFEATEKLHATLAFLGNVDDELSAPIAHALEQAAARCAPFAITVDKLGAFPHERKPRVVYAGSRAPSDGYREASAAVRSAYAALGFSFKDDAVMHVTIARVKEPHRALPSIEVQPATMTVRSIALFESVFEKEHTTSRYEVVCETALRA
jgi:2'-5' RNA ligase